jgi:hypothetical protein
LQLTNHISELSFSLSIGDRGGESLGEALTENKSVVILSLEKNSLNQDGASAIARGLAHNKTLESINLMNQTHSRWGDKCLDDFLEMFNFNMTLLKINWRLESRKSFALNKMITRNNEIDRRKKNGIAFDDLLPSGLRVRLLTHAIGFLPSCQQYGGNIHLFICLLSSFIWNQCI